MGPYLGTEVVDVIDLGGFTLKQKVPKPIGHYRTNVLIKEGT